MDYEERFELRGSLEARIATSCLPSECVNQRFVWTPMLCGLSRKERLRVIPLTFEKNPERDKHI